MPKTSARWRYAVGHGPARVVASERADRAGVVYLSFRLPTGERTNVSVGHRVREDGRVDQALADLAMAAAQRQSARLAGARADHRLTLGATAALVFDPLRGRYPAGERATLHAREVRRALDYAVRFWGAEQPWATLRRSDVRALWRNRMRDLRREGHAGMRGAELLVQRLLTVVRWLQDEEHVPLDAVAVGRTWKRELREDWKQVSSATRDYVPHRPRYSPEEYRALIRVSRDVDPRFHLLVELCAEQRLQGASRRLLRSDVNRRERLVQVPSHGRKGGTLIVLTEDQYAALADALDGGYLALLEQARANGKIENYPLFPQRRLVGWRAEGGSVERGHRRGHRMVPGVLVAPVASATRPPVSRSAIQGWWEQAERLAGITHVPGRGTRGMRRTSTDEAVALGATPAELEAWGGWTDSQTPQAVYREQEHRRAAERARDLRAKARKG